MIHLKPAPGMPGNHVYASNGIWAFDHSGWTLEAELLETTEKAYTERYSRWTYERIIVSEDLEAFCHNNNHRLPWQYAYLPWERAYTYMKQFPAVPPDTVEQD